MFYSSSQGLLFRTGFEHWVYCACVRACVRACVCVCVCVRGGGVEGGWGGERNDPTMIKRPHDFESDQTVLTLLITPDLPQWYYATGTQKACRSARVSIYLGH